MPVRHTRWARLVLAGAVATVGALVPSVDAQEHTASTARVSGQEAEGYFTEPRAITRGIDFAVRSFGNDTNVNGSGFYPEMSAMVTGAGWVSAGPGFRHWLFKDATLIDMSAAYSWRGYKAAQARLELPGLVRSRLAVGTQHRWQDLTQVSYFGPGADSHVDSRSEYRLTSHNAVAYATVRATPWLSLRVRSGWLQGPDLRPPTGHFQGGTPSTLAVFPADAALLRGTQPDYVHGDLAIVADTRDHRSHPVRGGLYRAAWAAFRDRSGGRFSFRRYEVEGAHFVPLASERIVFALHGWGVMSGTSPAADVPFYLQPSLGGHNTLRGFADYRFHDRHLLVVNAETRLALFTHLDGAMFVDAGNVAGRVRDLNLRRTSYGVGVRLHSSRATFVRFDVARGREGWRFLLRLHDPLRLARLSSRTAAAPFVP